MAFDYTTSYPMCGYMTMLTDLNYEGRAINGEDGLLQNCVHANLHFDANDDQRKSLFIITRSTNGGTLTGVVHSATTVYDGIPAIEILVKSITPGGEFFLIADQWDYNDDWKYDMTRYAAAKGDYVRLHRLHAGEMFIISLDPNIVETYPAGTVVTITGDNTMAPVVQAQQPQQEQNPPAGGS